MDKKLMEDDLREELGARKFQLKAAQERLNAATKRIATLTQRIAEIEVVLKPETNPNQTTMPFGTNPKDAK